MKRELAIELLLIETSVDEETIRSYSDFGLEAWLGELGYVWTGSAWELEEVQP